MATISLGMIVRNEGRTLEACLESVAPHVDQIVIGLAGESTDNTEEILKEVVTHYPEINWVILKVLWTDDFSAARNEVMARCEGEYYLWLDGDDILVGGEQLHGLVEAHPNVDAFYMGYDYARDEQGNNTCYLVRERLVKREGWSWLGAIHEVLVPKQEHTNMQVSGTYVQHHKPLDKHDPNRNLDILYAQLEASEPNPDPRILAYLGAENAGRGKIEEAILHWQRFVRLSGWDEERYQAQVRISNSYRQLGKLDKALNAAFSATAILPNWPDAYISLAKTYCSEPLFNYVAALEWLKVSVAKPIPNTMLIVNPMEYTYERSILIATCYSHLGDWEMALENFKNAQELRPDPTVAQQISLLTKEVNYQRVVRAFLTLREHLGRNDEWLKVRRLFDVVPKHIEHHPSIREAHERTLQQTAHVDEPQVMTEFYKNNPHWGMMEEAMVFSSDWLKHPRMKYALSVAERIKAESIVDWGCSDGFIALPLAKETGAFVRGWDLDPRCVDLAQERAERHSLNAQFCFGDVDAAVEMRPEERYDLAIFFEVIEHVVDPAATLDKLEKTAHHIAITTPYLAWENGEIPAWDKVEPKGHLRIFNTEDIERLLTGRGKIHNLYKQGWGERGWIFTDYEVGAKTDKKITIGAHMGMEKWGPQKLQAEGLGGSETAVIKLAEQFSEMNHRVFVYCPVDEPGYYNGVCYRDEERFKAGVRSDLYIAWRMPEAADWDINTGRLVLWMHDTDAGDRLTRERAERFDNIVVLTNWHKQFFLDKYPFVDPDKLVVIGNGIDLARFEEPVKKDEKKVVYSSSPDRGLDIILKAIWPRVIEKVPDAELHIYYGWQNFDKTAQIPGYQMLWEWKNALQAAFLDSKNVVQHGRISQDRLAAELQEATVWLYPTYFQETYCITGVEAQLAGAIPITNHLAGLAETVKSGIIIEGDVYDSNVQAKYAQAVVDALTASEADREKMHEAARKNAPVQTWPEVASLWAKFLEV